MPDILLLLCTPTNQSLNGVKEIALKILQARKNLPVDRLNLMLFPIPTRFDSSQEFGMMQIWIDRFANELIELYSDWLPLSVNIRDFINITKIPYIPYFSFDEKLAVLEQGTIDPIGMGYTYETIAALLATSLKYAEQLMDKRSELIKFITKR